eukprot:CAMPEP_0175490156 /NCGR_PEP_ID=MMETSP0096-20121207/1112_1 /TAXON_ID=311494 /ORGANISM="Alexandrium monilatum, Strain CCMP3105" /LENGTH=729 /DNA_ID=CAMNT_0016792061 /DNA_START=33 /DNA_END=2223 /DNA_ORIENTATION=-
MEEGAGSAARILDGPAAVRYIRARKALNYFKFRLRLKGLVLYFCFFITKFVHYNLETDWIYAAETVNLFRRAMDRQEGINANEDPWCDKKLQRSTHTGEACWWSFMESKNTDDLLMFLTGRITVFAGHMKKVCPECDVSIAAVGLSLESLSLEKFACADFDSVKGSNYYPPRDCRVADSVWSANPRADLAPCCENETLVQASMIVMAHAVTEGQQVWTTGLPSDLSVQSYQETWKKFIGRQLDAEDSLAQLVISRGQRMAGINFKAKKMNWEWSPGSVTVTKTYWSRRYDIPGTLNWLKVFALLFAILSGIHYLIECFAMYMSSRADVVKWAQRPLTWLTLASYVCPALAYISDSYVSVNTWTLLVGISEVVMLARLFFEAEVIPPCRILLKTMRLASGPLATLSGVLFVFIILLAGICGMLFGPFRYSDVGGAIMDVVGQFSTGPVIDSQADRFSPVASKLVYFLILFVLYLTLSQVFITILMDSFEAAREDKTEHELAQALPEGYVQVPVPASQHWLQHSIVGWLTYYLPDYKTTSFQLARALIAAIGAAEAADPGLVRAPVLLTEEQLKEPLASVSSGAGGSAGLLVHFAAELAAVPPTQPAGAQPSPAAAPGVPPPPAVAGQAGRSAGNQADRLAELQAEVWDLSLAADLPIPFSGLQELSKATLERLAAGCAREGGDPHVPKAGLCERVVIELSLEWLTVASIMVSSSCLLLSRLLAAESAADS